MHRREDAMMVVGEEEQGNVAFLLVLLRLGHKAITLA
jgi:hypothetical protein